MAKKYYRKNEKKKHSKLWLYIVLSAVLISAFTLVYKSYLSSDFNTDKPHTETQRPVETPLPEEISAKITDSKNLLTDRQALLLQTYAQRYADTLYYLERRQISHLYADASSAAFAVNKAALDVLTGIRNMKDIDLTLEYTSVEYIVDSVENNGKTAVVHLKENNTQKFRHLSQPSLSANLYHKFTLVETDNGWKIKEHYHEEDFYLLAMEGWEDATGRDNISRGRRALDIILADARENLVDLSQFQQGEYRTDLKVSDTSYNRDAAVNYAQQWWNQRNYTGNYLAYDDFGGNCQNFASQCIHAGGINMDYKGILDLQWKFYDEDLNTRQTATGRSYSWTGVDMFYTYALHSYKEGLVALTDIDYKYAEKGDIIHVGAYHQWRHALLITDVLTNADGTQQDIIVASNTADRWNYPLSAYIYTAPRLIHILGQNP